MSIVLGIETSCDETAASVVVDGRHILSNILYSQVEHSNFGGVFPELASRRHLEKLLPIIDTALEEAKVTPSDIDLIAVAGKPGLIGALLMGVTTAKSLSYAWKKPFVSVNHIEAHLYATMMGETKIQFPAIGLVVSGGHTSLVLIEAIGQYKEIGKTVDDAIGEAFDKVARLLGLGYPGGPKIEELAKLGDSKTFSFSAGRLKDKPFHFSFSGLKTQVLYTLKGKNASHDSSYIIDAHHFPDIAASFQEASLTTIVDSTIKASLENNVKDILIGGGVSNNRRLRALAQEKGDGRFAFHFPPPGLSLDNAAMIAGLGYHVFQRGGTSDSLDFTPSPSNKSLSF